MKTHITQFVLIFLNAAIISTGRASVTRQGRDISLVPKPLQVVRANGRFSLNPRTQLISSGTDSELKSAVEYLANILRTSTGFRLPIEDGVKMPTRNFIVFNYVHDQKLGEEGYRLDVDSNKISIGATDRAGFFYAVQSILQLLPPAIHSEKKVQHVQWKIPCLSIVDKPRFPWRGMHLDVSRHFFPVEFIRTYIDMLALHKFNQFHWHLTDDQGWRVEINKYPKLTSVGARRVNREDRPWNEREPQHEGEEATYGGFYTQEEIREIVRYAADRQITVVPEIEMPAHASAALAAYPEFSCTGGPFTVPPGGVWPNTNLYCAGNDSTFDFLQSILDEVIALFPGRYFHIGGDEADKIEWSKCPKCQLRMRTEGLKDESELQSYFIKRIEKHVLSKNRRVIGWDEILEGGLAPEATVMSWRGTDGGVAAARMNHDVIMTPGSHCYFDHYQGRSDIEPLAFGGYTPLSKVYEFEPIPDSLTPEQANHVLGAQANVWTEYISHPSHAQYMTLPRMAALSEVLWSSKEARNWSDFVPRLELLIERYAHLKYNYSKSAYLVEVSPVLDSATNKFGYRLSNEMQSKDIRYTLGGKDPTAHSSRYLKPLRVARSTTIRATAFHKGKPLSITSEQKILVHKALFRSVRLRYPYGKYNGGGERGLTDGVRGSTSFDDGNWQGFEQADLEAIVDLNDVIQIKSVTTGFLQNTNSWIFFPTHVEYAASENGVTFEKIASFEQPIAGEHQEVSIKDFPSNFKDVKARYIKVLARNVGLCPDWHAGRGEKAWLFTDEIIIE